MQATMSTGAGLTIGVPRETVSGERRVALIPDTVGRLVGQGLRVVIERDAGAAALYPDQAYADAGASIATDAAAVYRDADVICKVQRPGAGAAAETPLRPGQVLIAFLAALNHPEDVQALADSGVTAFGMEAIPRTTRAQAMDALSSQSNLAGYKAVVLAADHLGKLFPLLMTAAGTIAPSRVLVIGAGVAGLQAIATARRLGAVVEAYDTRPVVKEQVQSLGATFVEVPGTDADAQDTGGYAKEASAETLARQQAALADRSTKADVIITTALVPGRPAPRLISAATVAAMRPGSVIIDLASEAGGNCELTVHGETVVEHGVIIIGPRNLPADVPTHASQMYARNVQSLLGLIVRDSALALDFSDDIIAAACLTHAGEVRYGPTRSALGLPPLTAPEPEPGPRPEPGLVSTTSDDAEAVDAGTDLDRGIDVRVTAAGPLVEPGAMAMPSGDRPGGPDAGNIVPVREADDDGDDAGDDPSLLERASAWLSDTPSADEAATAAGTDLDGADGRDTPPASRTAGDGAVYGETGELHPLSAGPGDAGDLPEAPGFESAGAGRSEPEEIGHEPSADRGPGPETSTTGVPTSGSDPRASFPAFDDAPVETADPGEDQRPLVAGDDAIPLPAHGPSDDPAATGDHAAAGNVQFGWSGASEAPEDATPWRARRPADEGSGTATDPGDPDLAPHEAAFVDDLAGHGPAEAMTDTPDEDRWSGTAADPANGMMPLDQAPDVVSAPAGWASGDDGPELTILDEPPTGSSTEPPTTPGMDADWAPSSNPHPDQFPTVETDDPVAWDSPPTGDPETDAGPPDGPGPGGEWSDGDRGALGTSPGEPGPGSGSGPTGKGRPSLPGWRRR